MEAYHETLLTIYSIIKSESSPETYLCTPHEIILRQSQDWTTIKGLKFLNNHGLKLSCKSNFLLWKAATQEH